MIYKDFTIFLLDFCITHLSISSFFHKNYFLHECFSLCRLLIAVKEKMLSGRFPRDNFPCSVNNRINTIIISSPSASRFICLVKSCENKNSFQIIKKGVAFLHMC